MKDCNQCGKCCIKYSNGGLSVEAEELAMWKTFRPDISEYVFDGQIWMDPLTHQPIALCPWLRLLPVKAPNAKAQDVKPKFGCDIYEDRPNDCRYYPTSIDEMIRDECEMLDSVDLLNPKQAQKKLDILIIDSRPPLMG